MFKNEMVDDNEIFLFASLVIFVLRLRRRRNATKTMRPKRFWVGKFTVGDKAKANSITVRELRGGDRELYFR